MKIVTNVRVHDLAESIYASGYPMLTDIPQGEEWEKEITSITDALVREDVYNPHIRRAINLANAIGGGHDQFLTGILVSFDFNIENKLWVEAERYRFLNFVSSQSTMNRGAKLSISDCCNEYIDEIILARLTELQEEYNKEPSKEKYLKLLMNLPSGFKLTARMTTNYRCLKNIYWQRKTHRLPMWHEFCDWVETLPLASHLIMNRE